MKAQLHWQSAFRDDMPNCRRSDSMMPYRACWSDLVSSGKYANTPTTRDGV